MAEKISLFHTPKNAMWLFLGRIGWPSWDKPFVWGISRFRIFFVGAFLILSFMVFRLFLAFVSWDVAFSAYEEAV